MRPTERTCYFCKFACACGWHLWYCEKHDEDVSEQKSCPEWEDIVHNVTRVPSSKVILSFRGTKTVNYAQWWINSLY